METKRDVMHRLCGIRPPALLNDEAMAAWHKMDDLARHLVRAVEGIGCPRLASEYGQGQHRVLLVDHGERFELFKRPLFRERPRKVLELAANGECKLARGSRSVRCSPRFDVTVTGDDFG